MRCNFIYLYFVKKIILVYLNIYLNIDKSLIIFIFEIIYIMNLIIINKIK